MGLPFKNGFELAQAMGYGKMYQVSKQQEENNIQIESKDMNKQMIRITEQDLHKMIRESVETILKEIGDTNRGMYMLGRAQQRAAQRGDTATDNAIADKYQQNWKNNSSGRAFNLGYSDQQKGNKEQIAKRYQAYQN